MSMTDALPSKGGVAYAKLVNVETPTIDDLKLMVLLEAAGQGLYGGLADAAPNEAAKALLERNGREELAHAHRVSRVIEHLWGERVPVPAPEDNPLYERPQITALSRDELEGLMQAEMGGEALYDTWARNLKDDVAAKLLRQNGVEETRHGERMKEVLALL